MSEETLSELNQIQGYLRFFDRRIGPMPRLLEADEAWLWLEFSRACYALEASL